MKLQLSSITPKSLNKSGISHLMVPLLIVLTFAVGGTFMMVSSKAATTNGGTGADTKPSSTTKKAKKSKIDPNTSKLLIYSASGTFKSVKVTVNDLSSGNTSKAVAAKCGVAPKAVNGVIKKTPSLKKNKFNFSTKTVTNAANEKTYHPIIIICQDPPKDSYLGVTFSTKKATKSKFTGTAVLLSDIGDNSVDYTKSCSFVHYKEASDRTLSFTNGDCKDRKSLLNLSSYTEPDPAPAPGDPALNQE